MKLTKAEIEEIITYEVVVDCYSDEEANMGWAIYMEESIYYPFEAEYQVKKKDGKRLWSKVKVVGNKTDESNFEGGSYYVEIEFNDMVIPVDVDKLRNIEADGETMEALQVWQNRNNY
ncbi:MAG: calcium-binding protein [Saprospiraceae bacterium]